MGRKHISHEHCGFPMLVGTPRGCWVRDEPCGAVPNPFGLSISSLWVSRRQQLFTRRRKRGPRVQNLS